MKFARYLENRRAAARLRILEVLAAAMLLPSLAYAQSAGVGAGGLEKTQSFVQLIITIIGGIAVGVATIAIMVLGFRFLFGSASFQDIVKPVGGCLLIGSAGAIAMYLLG
jgi:type IV secretory pathway VirB2 component (pilin)